MKKKIILMLLLLLMKTADAACTSGVYAIYKNDNSLIKAFKITKYEGGYGFCVVDNIYSTCTINKSETNSTIKDPNYICFIDNNNNRVCTYKDYFEQTSCPESFELKIDNSNKRYLIKDSTKSGDNYSYKNDLSDIKSPYVSNEKYVLMNMSNNNYGPAFLQSETCSITYMKDKNYKKIYTYDKSCSFDVKEQLEVINGVPCLKSSLYNFETCRDKNPYTESKDTCKESLYYYHYQRANIWYPYVDFSETGCEKILQENGASECHFLGKYSLLDSKIPSENPPSENPPSENPPSENPSAGNTITDSTINIKNEENGAEYDEECGLLGDPSNEESLAHYINLLIEIIKYIGIILCVVLTIVDFAKGLFSEEKELPQNLSKKLWTRLILAISLFFLPMLIKPLLFFLGVYGNCIVK